MSYHKIKITGGIVNRTVELELDGQQLKGVRNVEFSMPCDDVTTVRFELIPEEIEIDVEAGCVAPVIHGVDVLNLARKLEEINRRLRSYDEEP